MYGKEEKTMSEYVITTDSNSDVRPEFIRENQLTIIPQYYAFGETVYGDELNMEPHEFYETMRKGELPKSMANNPAVIRERFERILKEGKDILHIAFSSALSGSCNNVVMTANELLEDYPERKIMVFDSLNASLGGGRVRVPRRGAVESGKEHGGSVRYSSERAGACECTFYRERPLSSSAGRTCVEDDCCCGKPCEYQTDPYSDGGRKAGILGDCPGKKEISEDAGHQNGVGA